MGKAKEMGALEVSRITRRGMNFVGGVAGLGMNVNAGGSRSWVLRARVGGVRRDMGLGGYPDVTLAQARELARSARQQMRLGLDPIEEGKKMRSALIASRAAAITFTKAASLYIEAHEESWKNEKHRQQWNNTLDTYAKPKIGTLQVRDVGVAQVLDVLEPIWKTKTETASRLRGRIESVLDWAIARGYREGPNPARWRGHLDTMLPAPGKIAKTDHHRALPYAKIGEFMAELRKQEGIGARALEFAILTAARSGEVRGATWAEFDLDGAPLTQVLRRMKVNAVPHGFRSTFRDWAAEQTDYPNEVAEMALAHAVGNKVEAAYRRGDLLEKRGQLMRNWASFMSQMQQ